MSAICPQQHETMPPMESRPWTLQDDNDFFAAHGSETSLGTDLSGAIRDPRAFPQIAANQLRLLRVAAAMTAPVLWIQALGVISDNHQCKAYFDVSTGLIGINQRVAKALELALSPGLESPTDPKFAALQLLPHELRDLKRALGAVLHEITHGGGGPDRGTFVRERLATHDDPRARAFLEGATEAKVARDLDLFISRLGLDHVMSGLVESQYRQHYPLESSFVSKLFDHLGPRCGTSGGNLLDSFVAQGCSLRALTDIVAATLPNRGQAVPALLDSAVETVLAGLESAGDRLRRSQHLRDFDEVEIQIGRAAAKATAVALSTLTVGRGAHRLVSA